MYVFLYFSEDIDAYVCVHANEDIDVYVCMYVSVGVYIC